MSRQVHTVRITKDTNPARPRILKYATSGEHAARPQIGRISDVFFSAVPDRFIDLIDIAAIVYSADKATTRGNAGPANMGSTWRRNFEFQIAVRDLDFWSNEETTRTLREALAFITDDYYEFEFFPLEEPRVRSDYLLDPTSDALPEIDEVSLFSGGLDSLGGAIDAAVLRERRCVFVCHESTQKMRRQRADLQQEVVHRAKREPIFVSLAIRIGKQTTRDYTQRSRPFLFASLAGTIAALTRVDTFRFYENGIVSVNLPFLEQVTGSKASRTTHPRTLAELSRLLTAIAERPIVAENPFLWKTRTDIVKDILKQDCGRLIGMSVSCSDTHGMKVGKPHCGNCTQCIGRRIGILAAEAQEYESSESYRVDLFTGPREKPIDRILLAGMIDFALKLSNITQGEFLSQFGEVARILSSTADSPAATVVKLLELHQKYGTEVRDAIARQLKQNAELILDRRFPATSLLAMVLPQSAATAGSLDSLQRQATDVVPDGRNVFWASADVYQIRFEGKDLPPLKLGVGGKYIQAALANARISFSVALIVDRSQHEKRNHNVLEDPQIDSEYLRNTQSRLRSIESEMAAAEKSGDRSHLRTLRHEKEEITEFLGQATAPSGQARALDDPERRFSQAVSMAVNRSLKKIAEVSPELHNHIRMHAKFGKAVRYTGPSGISWVTNSTTSTLVNADR